MLLPNARAPSILGFCFVVFCAKRLVSLHDSDLVSERLCSRILELWFVLVCYHVLHHLVSRNHSDVASERSWPSIVELWSIEI